LRRWLPTAYPKKSPGRTLVEKGIDMWAGVIYGSLLEHHGDHILLSGGTQIFLLDAATHCDFRVGTYLKVTYTELDGRKLARDISQSDSFHALNAPS
jgi:hypothetical protein